MSDKLGQSVSIWADVQMPNATPLKTNASADVCVVGAGIAGITTAYLLAREGKSVIVLDDSAIGGGETGRTTAHLTNAIDDRIYWLEEKHGADVARLAVESHVAAINRIEHIVKLENIACDFERLDGYLFQGDNRPDDELTRELECARRAGLSDTTWVKRAPITSFNTGRCLRFPFQAAFHPLKYLNALAEAIVRLGGRIYTDSRVDEEFEKGPPVRIRTMDGFRIEAASVVVATNAPAINFLEVQAKQVAMRTYAMAARIPRGAVTRALYWDTGDPYHYVRVHADGEDNDDLLIVGGEDHKTGQDGNPAERFVRLEQWMRERFPMATTVVQQWSGQVIEPIDGLAFIGHYESGERNLYCATGDSGMGMTHGTIAGMLLTDLIMERENPWKDVYAPNRKTFGTAGAFLGEALDNAKQLRDWVTPGDAASADEIAPGTGAVLRRGVHKIAAYRDPGGTLHERSAVCTHLGCIVKWNAFEHTWDCPCHGSRFNPVGKVINGPAVSDLTEVQPESPRESSANRVSHSGASND